MARRLGNDVEVVITATTDENGERAAYVVQKHGEDHLAVVVPFVATFTGASLPFDVELLIDRDAAADAGRVRIAAMRVVERDDGGMISTDELGRLPLKRMVERAVFDAGVPVVVPGRSVRFDPSAGLELTRERKRRAATVIGDAELEEVAELARLHGVKGSYEVAIRFQVERSTAWRAIQRAAKHGHDVGDRKVK